MKGGRSNMVFLNSLRDLFKQSIPEMVVKYSVEAQAHETTETNLDSNIHAKST